MKPLIAITPSPSRDTLPHGTFIRYAMASAYVEAIVIAGGVPVILPPQDGHAGRLLDAVDGLLLSGGGDVEPVRYGDDRVHETTYGVSPERDRFEIELFREALARDLPVLGICRGVQVMNVALGGTLVQDIAAEYDGPVTIPHRQQEAGRSADEIGHAVAVTPGTPTADLLGEGEVGVNSYHHQAIARVAPGLNVAARAPDGIVEAVSMPDRRFVLGVQWHPELMFVRYPARIGPFVGLVEAASSSILAVP